MKKAVIKDRLQDSDHDSLENKFALLKMAEHDSHFSLLGGQNVLR